jgi:hypothetical protein
VTIGNAAVHTARGLGGDFFVVAFGVNLFPILDAFQWWTIGDRLTLVFEKSGRFTHEK